MMFKEAISQRIYELCDKYNYSPNRLAKLSAIPPSTLRAMLSNKVDNPSAYNIYKICKTLKISLKDFYVKNENTCTLIFNWSDFISRNSIINI